MERSKLVRQTDTRKRRNEMRKSLHLTTEFLPRKLPCFAVGFVSSGSEFVLHLYLVCFRIRWGY